MRLFEFLNEGDVLGKKSPSFNEVLKMHSVSRSVLEKELKMGIEEEYEHTDNKDEAKEIALDHLAEDPRYYTKLSKAMD